MNTKELFFKLLEFPSITPDDAGSLEFIENYMEGFKAKRIDVGETKNLFLYKKFTDGKHLNFAGHIDVVPPGDGWDSDPFTPIQKNGYIYARGAQDMKSGVAAFLKACKETKDFEGTLSIIITSDEEGDAKDGTIKVLEYLKTIDFLPDYSVVAEPTCEVRFGDAIKIGRRGSINGILELFGVQGHAAYPEKSKNPIDLIAPLLKKIAGYNLDNGDENFSPSKIVVTDIRSGMEVTNVTPGYLKMMFNVRNSTATLKEDIDDYFNKVFKGLDYKLTLFQSAKPFITDRESKIVKLMIDSINDVVGKKPKLSTAGGTSDARILAEFGVDTIEFGVINDTIHAVNERTTIEEVESLERVFKRVIERF